MVEEEVDDGTVDEVTRTKDLLTTSPCRERRRKSLEARRLEA